MKIERKEKMIFLGKENRWTCSQDFSFSGLLNFHAGCCTRFQTVQGDSSTPTMYVEGKKTKDSQVIWQETKEFSSRNLPAFYQMFHDNYCQDVPLLKIGYFFSGNLVLIWEGEVVGQFSLFCSSQQGIMNSQERRKLRVF